MGFAGMVRRMNADATDASTLPLLEINDATVLRGGRPALDRFSLRVEAGRHTAILGANGSGKSTLVQLIARQLYPLAPDNGRGPEALDRIPSKSPLSPMRTPRDPRH